MHLVALANVSGQRETKKVPRPALSQLLRLKWGALGSVPEPNTVLFALCTHWIFAKCEHRNIP